MPVEVYYEQLVRLTGIGVWVTGAGLAITIVQLWILNKNRKKQLKQARIENTVEMVKYYSQNLTIEGKCAERIVRNFTEKQCRDLYEFLPVTVDSTTLKKICEICPELEKKACEDSQMQDGFKCKMQNGSYILEDYTVNALRGYVITYLNNLESVLLAWQLGSVEQKALQKQFEFLNRDDQREYTLQTFREVAGNGKSYPAIDKFYKYLNYEKQKAAKKEMKELKKNLVK